jgi:hypothetical protein
MTVAGVSFNVAPDPVTPGAAEVAAACPAPSSQSFLTEMLGKMEANLDRMAAHPTGYDAMPLLSITLQCGAAISSMLPTLGMGLDPDARLGLRHIFHRAATQIFVLLSHAQTRTKTFTEALVRAGVVSKAEADAACSPLLKEEALAAKRLIHKIEGYRSTFLGKLANVFMPRASIADLVTDMSILHMTHDSLMTLYDTIEALLPEKDGAISPELREKLRDTAASMIMRCETKLADMTAVAPATATDSKASQETATEPNAAESVAVVEPAAVEPAAQDEAAAAAPATSAAPAATESSSPKQDATAEGKAT